MHEEKVVKNPKKHRARKIVSGVLSWLSVLAFAVLIVAAVAAVYLITTDDGRPRTIAGYSAYIVLTGSMQSVIPQGSLVLVRKTAPEDIGIGDDITFMITGYQLVTHRVIAITEDLEGTGEYGFTTKGVDNPYADREIVFYPNVVGKVVFHSLQLGEILSYIQYRVWLIALVPVVAFLLFLAIRRLIRFIRQPNEPDPPEDELPQASPDEPRDDPKPEEPEATQTEDPEKIDNERTRNE